jgi:hypothetical protein
LLPTQALPSTVPTEPVKDRVLILDRGEDNFTKPKRGDASYRTEPIPWPTKPTDEHYDKVPGNLAPIEVKAISGLPDYLKEEGFYLNGKRVSWEQLRAAAAKNLQAFDSVSTRTIEV